MDEQEMHDRMYREGLRLGETLVRVTQEGVASGLSELVSQRADAVSAERSLVEAIKVTDKAIREAADDDLRTDLRAQRQQLVDALCGLSGAKPKEV